jgi:hypothetical protein
MFHRPLFKPVFNVKDVFLASFSMLKNKHFAFRLLNNMAVTSYRKNALSSAMDLNFECRHFFSDDIFPGIKVVDTISKSKRLLMLSSCMVNNCVEVLKRHVWICISFVYLTKQCRS